MKSAFATPFPDSPTVSKSPYSSMCLQAFIETLLRPSIGKETQLSKQIYTNIQMIIWNLDIPTKCIFRASINTVWSGIIIFVPDLFRNTLPGKISAHYINQTRVQQIMKSNLSIFIFEWMFLTLNVFSQKVTAFGRS